MIGDTIVSEGIEFEVVWSGGELLAGRITKSIGDIWSPIRRNYNKSGMYKRETEGFPDFNNTKEQVNG